MLLSIDRPCVRVRFWKALSNRSAVAASATGLSVSVLHTELERIRDALLDRQECGFAEGRV